MKRLVIGDIHGCYAELMELLDRAALGEQDEIIAIGDIVDRGPDTPRTLDFFRSHPRARSLMGNHERKHIRSSRGELRPALSQVISRQQLGSSYPAAVDFMQAFPLFVELPEALLVHGFWEPGVPLKAQREQVLTGTMGGENYLRDKYGWPWFGHYDGSKPIVVGHRHYLENGRPLIVEGRVYGIDTGCVRGGRLTGLLLPDFSLVSVPARANHWQRMVEAYTADSSRRRVGEMPAWTQDGDGVLSAILAYILQTHDSMLAELRAIPSFDTLPEREQARAYAVKVAGNPLEAWLHQARHGKLDVETLRKHFWWPERAETFAEGLGIDLP
jgi:serine/threonine protein phosphatase 1